MGPDGCRHVEGDGLCDYCGKILWAEVASLRDKLEIAETTLEKDRAFLLRRLDALIQAARPYSHNPMAWNLKDEIGRATDVLRAQVVIGNIKSGSKGTQRNLCCGCICDRCRPEHNAGQQHSDACRADANKRYDAAHSVAAGDADSEEET